MKKSVLVVDDHPLYQKALASMVRELGVVDEVFSSYSAEEGLRLLKGGEPPSLILLDLGLPGINGVEAVRVFRGACPRTAIVIVSGSDQRHEALAAARAGADAVVSKGVEMDAMRTLLVRALAGELSSDRQWFTPPAERSLRTVPTLRLTRRQVEIVALLNRGLSNKEIGMRIGLAEITVKTHLSAVFKLLGVTNRTQAVMAIRKLGLAPAEDAPGAVAEPPAVDDRDEPALC